jgi:purine-nucleoside phosphorylase
MKRARAQAAADKIRKLCSLRPRLAIVLGSGFNHAFAALKIQARMPYERIPGFATPRVRGHRGELILGQIADQSLLLLRGRCHFYEGHAMDTVTFPMRMLAAYGIQDLLLTNAAGGINRKFKAGDLMVIKDHINLMGTNPLRSDGGSGEPAFVDLTDLYDSGLSRLLLTAGKKCGLKLRIGVYVAVSGPSYETPAEIRAFRALGADAVGMSTAPEAIMARKCGLRVAGLSCITNLAAGLGESGLSHGEVLETAANMGDVAGKLLTSFVGLYRRAEKDSG